MKAIKLRKRISYLFWRFYAGQWRKTSRNILECFGVLGSQMDHSSPPAQNVPKYWLRFPTFYVIFLQSNVKLNMIHVFSTGFPSFWWLNYGSTSIIKRDTDCWSWGQNLKFMPIINAGWSHDCEFCQWLHPVSGWPEIDQNTDSGNSRHV